jgi:phage tail-like protein
MPEVVGLPLRKARLLVENAGLVVDDIRFSESYETRDTVLSQKPARGQMVYAGDKVTVSVSRESYVKWLPSIYQRADINGRNFYRDFLWILQHLFSTIEEQLDVIHTFFDPYEAPEKFLPWLASWSAMVLEEDWPIEKKRRLIRRAIELYRIRGTVKGLKLFISMFTGHEPEIKENVWPFRGWRIGVTSDIGIDTVVLPPVNLAHTCVVEMPVSYQDISPEAVIRIHEILQMEKPANVQYYLRFAAEGPRDDLNEFMAIGGGVIGGIGLASEADEAITSEEDLKRALEQQKQADTAPPAEQQKRKTMAIELDDGFQPMPRTKPPLPKAPRADTAPVEGREGPRSSKAGGFDGGAREMGAVSHTQAFEVMKTEEMERLSTQAMRPAKTEAPAPRPTTTSVEAQKPAAAEAPKAEPKAKAPADEAKKAEPGDAADKADKPEKSDKSEKSEKSEEKAKDAKKAPTAEAPKSADDRKTRIGTPVVIKDDKKDPEKK